MSVSVVIPVYNEQSRINETISNLNDCQIIISDCNGKTIEAVNDNLAVKLLSAPGRGQQLNAGAERADGNIILFLHADTKLPYGWQEKVIDALSESDAGAFSLGIDSKRKCFRIIEFFTNIRCRLTKIPYGDQAIFIRKDVFKRLQGFSDFPIFEDVDLMRRLKKKGYKVSILSDRVLTSARRWEKEGVLYTTLRNWLITILYLCGASPLRLAAYYRKGVK